jgi:hypothetical protein
VQFWKFILIQKHNAQSYSSLRTNIVVVKMQRQQSVMFFYSLAQSYRTFVTNRIIL